VVAGDHIERDTGVAQAAELFQSLRERAVAGRGAVEKIAGMDHGVGSEFQRPVDYVGEGVVHVLFARINALVVYDVEGVKSQVGIGEVEQAHTGGGFAGSKIIVWQEAFDFVFFERCKCGQNRYL
jgi:hypothetical protein